MCTTKPKWLQAHGLTSKIQWSCVSRLKQNGMALRVFLPVYADFSKQFTPLWRPPLHPPPPPSQWRKYAKPMKYIYPKPSYEDLGSGWEGEEEKKRSKIKRSGSVQKFAKRQSYTSALKAVIFSQIALLQRELHLPEHKLPVKTTSSHTQRKWRKMQSIFVASDDSRINLSK